MKRWSRPSWGAALTVGVVGAVAVVGGAACGAPGAAAPEQRPYTGPLVDSAALQDGFLWQQEIRASRGPFSHSFPAVLQSSRGVLTVLGLTPFRTRAFVIRQRGQTFEYESFVERSLPLEPSWVLIDIHRTFFDGVPRRAPQDGTFTHVAGGERRVDEWRDGLLRSRTYERLDAPGDLIRIDYGAGYRWGTPPPRLELHNGWYGYRLEVVTTSADALPSPTGQAPPDEPRGEASDEPSDGAPGEASGASGGAPPDGGSRQGAPGLGEPSP